MIGRTDFYCELGMWLVEPSSIIPVGGASASWGRNPSPSRDWARDFRLEVAKQHDVYSRDNFRSTRAVSWLDNNNRKLLECFNEDWQY